MLGVAGLAEETNRTAGIVVGEVSVGVDPDELAVINGGVDREDGLVCAIVVPERVTGVVDDNEEGMLAVVLGGLTVVGALLGDEKMSDEGTEAALDGGADDGVKDGGVVVGAFERGEEGDNGGVEGDITNGELGDTDVGFDIDTANDGEGEVGSVVGNVDGGDGEEGAEGDEDVATDRLEGVELGGRDVAMELGGKELAGLMVGRDVAVGELGEGVSVGEVEDGGVTTTSQEPSVVQPFTDVGDVGDGVLVEGVDEGGNVEGNVGDAMVVDAAVVVGMHTTV
jgi:hypothetical protein